MANELIDHFPGSAGSAVVGTTPAVGPAWSGSTAFMYPGSDVRASGAGFVYNASSGSSLLLSPATYAGSAHQVRATFLFLTDVGLAQNAGVGLYTPADASADCRLKYYNGQWVLSGPSFGLAEDFAYPGNGARVEVRITAVDGSPRSILCERSSDGGATWTTLFGGAQAVPGDSNPFAPALWFDGTGAATTGLLVGNLRAGSPAVLPSAAAFSGPSSGVAGVASTNFTVALDLPAPSGGTAVAVSDNSSGGTLSGTGVSGSTLTIAAGQTGGTFRYTNAGAGTFTLRPTSSGVAFSPATLDYTTTAPALVAGTATGGSTTSTTAAATATDATGGTTPYTYQWYRSTASSTLGAAVSGQTGRTLADTGLAPATSYYYTLRYTDAAAAHADSNQVALSTAGAALAAGTATAGATTATTASATATDATGGTTPYTYQWYRSTAGGTLGAAVSGQTSRALSDSGLSPSTGYYYTLRYTDAAAAHADSNQVAGTTAAVTAAVKYLSKLEGAPAGLVAGSSAGFGYRVSWDGGAYGALVSDDTITAEEEPGAYTAAIAHAAGSVPKVKWYVDGSTPPYVDAQVAAPSGGGTGGVLSGPVSLADGAITRATLGTDIYSDGAMRAASGPTQVSFDVADRIANVLPTGPVGQYVAITAGAGLGQVIPVASIAGASGAKIGAIQAGYTLATPLDTTSLYQWTGQPTTASVDATGGGRVDTGAILNTPPPTSTSFWASGSGLLGRSGDYVAMSIRVQEPGKPSIRRGIAGHTIAGGLHYFALAGPPAVTPYAAGATFAVE